MPSCLATPPPQRGRASTHACRCCCCADAVGAGHGAADGAEAAGGAHEDPSSPPRPRTTWRLRKAPPPLPGPATWTPQHACMCACATAAAGIIMRHAQRAMQHVRHSFRPQSMHARLGPFVGPAPFLPCSRVSQPDKNCAPKRKKLLIIIVKRRLNVCSAVRGVLFPCPSTCPRRALPLRNPHASGHHQPG